MVVLLRATEDDARRADIIRQLCGVKDEVAKREFLERLRLDQSEVVRHESAESLGAMLDDPLVVTALEYARDYDPSERVRNQAAESLALRKKE